LIVAKLHQEISNSRNDYLHNISHKLTSKNQTIVIEDIRVKELIKNTLLAKYICDIAWGEFVRQLEYKSKWRGRNLIKIDRFFPSSKTSNNYNYINQELKLSDRTWKCPCCNATLDQDFNASQNILKQGLLITVYNAVGVTV
jgi:putative transposase